MSSVHPGPFGATKRTSFTPATATAHGAATNIERLGGGVLGDLPCVPGRTPLIAGEVASLDVRQLRSDHGALTLIQVTGVI